MFRRHTVKIIAVAATKGGTGKTSICAGIATAVPVFDPEVKVAIVDLDPQGSLTDWWNLRSLRQPVLLELTPQALAQALEGLREGLDLLLLDCPEARPPREPSVRRRRSPDGRRVGATLPVETYVRFKAYVARHGGTGEEVIVGAIEALPGD
jgi:Mrp family chromosome partitioning ATPase